MTSAAADAAAEPRASFWRAPHRPLMLCAVLAALAGPLLAAADPQNHARMMVFGFAGGAIAAYLLTVLPGWTGARASPARVALLTALWLLGRLLPGPAEALFFLLLAATLAPPVLRAQLWDRLWAPLAAVLLAMAALMPGLDSGVPPLLIAALIAVVGGRALPSFLASAARLPQPSDRPLIRIATALYILGAAVLPHPGWYAAAVAALAWQMLQWPLRLPPIGLLLLPPWLWLAASLLLMMQWEQQPSLALHTLTMGGIGGMIHAFLSRVFARRTGAGLAARPTSLAGAALLHAAVIARLAEMLPSAHALWGAAWAITLLQLICHCRQPHRTPVFIGPRSGAAPGSGKAKP